MIFEQQKPRGRTVAAKKDEDKGESLTMEAYALATSPTHLLHRAQQLAANKSASALKEAGLTIRQFAVLEALSEIDGASQSQLVDATAIDRSTLADMVARMERSGLLERVQSESDARAKSVTLTDAGRKALDIARPAVAQADVELMDVLPRNRRGSFLSILSHIADVSDETLLDLEKDEEGRKTKMKKKDKKKAEPKAKASSGKSSSKKKKKKK